MRRRQLFAQMAAGAAPMPDRFVPVAAAVLQTEMAPSAIMMLSEATVEGGEVNPIPLNEPSAAGQPQSPGGAPCPKCGKALGKQGRHFHVRKCNG